MAYKTKVIQRDLSIFTHLLLYPGIFTHVLVYFGKFSYIQTLSDIFRNCPSIFRQIQKSDTLCHTGTLGNLVCLKPWYIRFRTLVYSGSQASSKFTTLPNICDRTFYENKANSLFALFLNMPNCDLRETSHNKVNKCSTFFHI